MYRNCKSYGLVAALWVAGGCGFSTTEGVPAGAVGEIEASLERYQAALRSLDADSIAAMYALDAILFEPGIPPVETREAIRAFVSSFQGVRIDSASAVPDTIQVFGGTAYLWGSYFERLTFTGQPESEQEGRFVMQWSRQSDGAWLIRRLFRVPISTIEFEGG